MRFSFDARTAAVLDAIARVGSVSGAARALGMDPSNAHRHLRTAARRAGAPLVARRGRGVVLTRVGAGLHRRAPGGAGAHGRAQEYDAREGTTRVVLGQRTLHVAGRVTQGPVVVAFRPEDVTLTRAPVASSARNAIAGRVASVRAEAEGTWRVVVLCGALRVPALVTSGARRDLRLREGSRVVAVLKATAITATPA